MSIQDMAAHFNDVARKENRAVHVELSDGKRIALRSMHSDEAFHIERASDGTSFLVGFPPANLEGLQTQVTTAQRRSRTPAEAIAEAEAWMRRF
jgi:hypothetical protein